MLSRELIEQILEAGIHAPSGENSQPWRLKIDGERVWLFNRPEADQSLFNFHQNGSLVAHGAFLANMKVAAKYLGCEANITLFPDETKENLIAAIDFKESMPATDAESKLLFEAITKRVTNRKHYDGSPLKDHEKKEILANEHLDSKGNSIVRLVMIEDREKIVQVARAASTSETMLVLNKHVHDFFFSHVRWTEQENEIQPNGFYIDTLELNAKQAKGFNMLKHWGAARMLGKIGVAKQVGKDNEETYKTASAMIGIIIKDPMPRNLILAGKVLEHAWLTATKLGLSVQPSTGALFLAEGIPHENWGKFSESQRTALLDAKKAVYEAFNVDHHKEHIAVVFRVGHAEPPSARAARFPLEMFLSEAGIRAEKALPKLAADRRVVIDHVLKDLATLKDNPTFANQYAINELIAFFTAIKTYPSYVRWIARRAPKLDRTRLLELTDLPFPRWDRAMHEKLVELESQKFPGLITPLVNRLLQLIIGKKDSGPFIALHLGSGGREVDRQVLKMLIDKKYPGQVVLIGDDISSIANELAKENLREIEPFIAIYESKKITKAELDGILKKETSRHVVISAQNDIFSLSHDFPARTFDVVYHTLFKHHLNDLQKEKLDLEIAPLGKTLLEYDGLKSWPFLIGPHTWSSWQNPPLMNGSIFSNLRYSTKEEMKNIATKRGGQIHFFKIATYLFER
jgi:hypothetical protein